MGIDLDACDKTSAMARSLLIGMVVLWLSSASRGHASVVDVEEVTAVLSEQPWITVDARAHIAVGADRWQGSADLSFRYRMRVHHGTLWLWVDVTDDRPGILGAQWWAHDHVELRIADPALAKTYATQRAGIQKTVQEFRDRLPDEVCGEEVQGFLQRQQKLVRQLEQDRYYGRYWLSPSIADHLSADHEGKLVEYAYVPRVDGYQFYARLPLFLACDFARPTVTHVGFSIDVVDVDANESEDWDTVIASMNGPRFDDPGHFSVYGLPEPYDLPLGVCERRLPELQEQGFWRRATGRYEYVAWLEEVWSGCTGADRSVFPGVWQPLPAAIAVPPDFTLRVVPFGDTLMLSEGAQCAVVNAGGEGYPPPGGSGWRPLFRASDADAVYAVLEGWRYTRWPPGSTMCGAGVETELVWLKLDKSLHLAESDRVEIESCFGNVEVVSSRVSTRGFVVDYARHEKDVTTRSRVTYDNTRPAEGLVRERAPAATPP